MSDLISYNLADGVATITMDDGKVNALSSAMLTAVMSGLDRAEADAAIVVLTGRERTFSAGFDLRCEGEKWPQMLVGGARLAERLLTFPSPVVIACNGNAIAMGGFALLSADHRVGADGAFSIGLTEVAIGLTVPWFGIEIARHRLNRRYFDRCLITGALLDPAEAVTAGFLDRVVEHEHVLRTAIEVAESFKALDRAAHAATKLRIRDAAIAGVRDGIERIQGTGREW